MSVRRNALLVIQRFFLLLDWKVTNLFLSFQIIILIRFLLQVSKVFFLSTGLYGCSSFTGVKQSRDYGAFVASNGFILMNPF